MKTLAMVNAISGVIEVVITCPENLVQYQTRDGCIGYEIDGSVQDDTHYYDGHCFKLYPPKPEHYYEFDLLSESWIDNRTTSELAHAHEEACLNFRLIRNAKLSACDWTQIPDAPVDKAAWAIYRQALRDLPSNTVDPLNPVWPTPPII